MYMSALFAQIYVCCVHGWYLQSPGEGNGVFRAGVTGCCKRSCGSWEQGQVFCKDNQYFKLLKNKFSCIILFKLI